MDIFYPIQLLADALTYGVFRIAPDTLLASAVNFFIFDTAKIFVLLAVIIFAVSISLPEFMILKRVMKMRLILLFAGIVGVGIMLTGYLFNAIL